MIRDDATQRQVDAAAPDCSTWLSANAGSGKTRVLTDRVARLLLAGTRPENILCLTYTKAAASEMQNRLFARLGSWAMMPEGELRKALNSLGDDTTIDPEDIRRARTLFAAAIETPGGLKIQTIHSFCAGVLRRFPLEAGVSPQFREMEDRAAQLLREEVLDDMAEGSECIVVENLARHYTGAEIGKFLEEITGRKASFLAPTKTDDLASAFGIPPHATAQDAVDIAFVGGEADLARDLAEASRPLTKTYTDLAAKLQSLNLDKPDSATLETVFGLLLYAADKTSKSRNWPDSRHKKAVIELEPLIEDMHAWMDRTAEAYDFICRVNAMAKTRALHDFAVPFVKRYEAKKLERAALDFDDLIGKAKALLEDPQLAQWVLFRLDGGVDHVLVDEAQDTSPDQWEIVKLLTQEFSTGEGARSDRERTVFVVGDKKQSIYSFQGADPEGFDRMREHFSAELEKVNKPLKNTSLLHSFRSSQAILTLVDQIFQGDMSAGVGDNVQHLAFHAEMPGRVDLWPAIEPSDKPEETEWDDPIDQKGQTNHKVLLAKQIAVEVKRMLRDETLPIKLKDDQGWARRKVTPGDILILVQRRSDIFTEIIAACKSEGLEIAGADRLKLGAELAVKDITALLQFLALPEDDLSLASALKSPLLGWDEKALYGLAQGRPKGQTLWEALRKSNATTTTLDILNDLRRQSDYLRPYDLINRLLVRHSGRANLLARLGHEAEDGIDALLSQALGYEQSDVPSLTGFLSWLQTEDVTVKRQMDAAGDRIRVMTVHGAKGLEAPIVILPDTAKRDRKLRGDLLFDGDRTFWAPKSEVMPEPLVQVKEEMLSAQDREQRRLLYVALTRAENWLIVAGAGKTGEGNDSWHSTLTSSLEHLDAVTVDLPFGPIRRFARHDWNAGEMTSQDRDQQPKVTLEHFDTVLPELAPKPILLSPSELGGDKALVGETEGIDTDSALAFGRLIHLLLEVLPSVPEVQWSSTGLSLIRNHEDAGLISDPDTLLLEALAILRHPDLSRHFKTGLAEVPITAEIEALGGQRIYGIIDLLIVDDDRVLAIDFKSNTHVPDNVAKTPLGLLRQMAAYRDALKQIYPTRRIETALLWTKSCTLNSLPDDLLNRALDGVTTP